MAATVEVAPRRGREGSRWYNARPTSEEIASWFKTVPLHDGMQHEDYIGGLTLIQSKEKSNEVTGYDNRGFPQIQEREDLVYVPYVKVETRVAYFWHYVGRHADDDWEGEIATIDPVGGEGIGLPPGFFRYTAAKPDGKEIKFVGCTKQVRIWQRSRVHDGPLASVMSPSQGTKTVPVATRWDVDANAFMKAETGAVGRALGFAGMLVIPGSGVATAEDMLELSTHNSVEAAADAQPPADVTDASAGQHLSDEELRAQAQTLVAELGKVDEAALERFHEWARGRKLRLDAAQGAALRGVIRKLESSIEAARA